jgi:hypothetical protein
MFRANNITMQSSLPTPSTSPSPSSVTCQHCGHNADATYPMDISPSPTPQRINELLQNNIPPLDSELHELSEKALSISRKYSDLEDEIAAMQHRLDQMKARRDTLGKEVIKYHAVTSPVRRLPADILCEIFQWNVEDDVSTLQFFNSLDNTAGPWLPTYVCRRWREVALSYSKIWSSVSVRLPAFSINDRKRATKASFLLGLQLARSSTQPLGVRVEYHDFDFRLDNYHPVIVALVPSSSRWKDFVTCMPPDAFDALSALSSILPNLRFADIRPLLRLTEEEDMNMIVAPDASYSIDFLDAIPELRELQLADIGSPVDALPSFNWGSVRRIDLWKAGRILLDTTIPALRTLLQRAQRLEEFFIEGIDIIDSMSDIGTPAVRMDHLHSIGSYDSIHDATVAGVDIWTLITAPKLESITIVDDQWSISSVTAMVRRSECKITNLEIRLPDSFLSADAYSLFEALPDLVGLTISPRSDAEALDALVKILIVRSPHNVSLPHLRKISIETEVFCNPSDFVELICSRNLPPLAKGVEKLKEVELSAMMQFPESRDRLKLKRCAEGGFTLVNGSG